MNQITRRLSELRCWRGKKKGDRRSILVERLKKGDIKERIDFREKTTIKMHSPSRFEVIRQKPYKGWKGGS